ncbi:liprin-alpha-1-like, partial [Moschus berezovskii]|uniref:liprin-alpha-1-like n=1 Tax=Moschus berezovskii TaxID=68408 RepID=UPI0024453270
MGRRRAILWALFQCFNPKAKAKTRKNLASDRVLEAEWPEKVPTSTQEVNVYRKQLLEREEELAELRAERNNTRLLLEHLEYLVSRNMPSLRMTVGKQQEQPPASMTSELEVLRVLKFLFDHHKSLDEKLRERLGIALERCHLLEEELGATHKQVSLISHRVISVKVLCSLPPKTRLSKASFPPQRSSNGSLSHEQNLAKMSELQEVIDKQSRKQSQMKERLAALSAHVRELEEDLDTARKKLLKSEEVNTKLERDVREAMAQKEDMEKRIITLKKCSLTTQREAAYVHDFNDKLENEIANEDSMHRQAKQGDNVKEENNKRMADLEDKVQTLKEQGWERVQQASVLANVAQAFESDEGVSDSEDDGVTLFSSATQLSPSGQNDAETPTVTLQGQLDTIIEEIRLIEEKNTEQPAEETESSVGRGSLGNF